MNNLRTKLIWNYHIEKRDSTRKLVRNMLKKKCSNPFIAWILFHVTLTFVFGLLLFLDEKRVVPYDLHLGNLLIFTSIPDFILLFVIPVYSMLFGVKRWVIELYTIVSIAGIINLVSTLFIVREFIFSCVTSDDGLWSRVLTAFVCPMNCVIDTRFFTMIHVTYHMLNPTIAASFTASNVILQTNTSEMYSNSMIPTFLMLMSITFGFNLDPIVNYIDSLNIVDYEVTKLTSTAGMFDDPVTDE